MRNLLIIGLLLLSSISNVSAFELKFEIKNYPTPKVYLASVVGGHSEVTDTLELNDGIWMLTKEEAPISGMYKLVLSDSVYLSFIINNENVNLQTAFPGIINNLKVLESTENKILFDWVQTNKMFKDSMSVLEDAMRYLPEEPKRKYKKQMKIYQKKVVALNKKHFEFLESYKTQHQQRLAMAVIKCMKLPSFNEYQQKEGASKYPNSSAFLKEHFFDHIDFTDERLLRTEIIFQHVQQYLERYVSQNPNNERYIAASELILSKAKESPAIYDYLVQLLVSNFESTIWESTFIHLVENHLVNTNLHEDVKGYQLFMAQKIRQIQIGNQLPDIKGVNFKGDEIKLKTDTNYKVLFIWSPDCEECHEMIPVVNDIVQTYSGNHVQVYNYAIIDDTLQWKNYTKELGLQGIHFSDLKGYVSEVVDDFYVWETPRIFVIDKDNNIQARPRWSDALHRSILEMIYKRK